MSIPAVKAATQSVKTDVVVDDVELEKETLQEEELEDSLDNESLDEEKAFEEAVSQAANKIKRGKDGKYIVPKDLPKDIRLAALVEKRRRDTQSQYTKLTQDKKALEAENAALKKKALTVAKLDLTDAQREELEDLKFSDPEAWRKRLNKLEREALAKHQEALDQELKQVSTETLAKDELERREEVLAEFSQANPDIAISDEVIQNDIPPRITKLLETGEISFEAFLQMCYDYLKTGKVIKQTEKVRGQPNLSKVGGSTSPDKRAEKEDVIKSYSKEVF